MGPHVHALGSVHGPRQPACGLSPQFLSQSGDGRVRDGLWWLCSSRRRRHALAAAARRRDAFVRRGLPGRSLRPDSLTRTPLLICAAAPIPSASGGLLARFSSIDFTEIVGRVGFVSTAIALMYSEFKSDVVQSGVDDQARSEGIWRHCDIDRSNMFDFKEFLYLLYRYLWQYAMDV